MRGWEAAARPTAAVEVRYFVVPTEYCAEYFVVRVVTVSSVARSWSTADSFDWKGSENENERAWEGVGEEEEGRAGFAQ